MKQSSVLKIFILCRNWSRFTDVRHPAGALLLVAKKNKVDPRPPIINHDALADQNHTRAIVNIMAPAINALMSDIRRGDLAAVKRALERQPALLHARAGAEQRTPLHVAAEVGNHLVLRTLLQQGADYAAADAAGEVPLMLAARQVCCGLVYGCRFAPNSQCNNTEITLHTTQHNTTRHTKTGPRRRRARAAGRRRAPRVPAHDEQGRLDGAARGGGGGQRQRGAAAHRGRRALGRQRPSEL
jgi:hypothetical protein